MFLYFVIYLVMSLDNAVIFCSHIYLNKMNAADTKTDVKRKAVRPKRCYFILNIDGEPF